MAAAAVASTIEENVRTIAQTKRIRVSEFFQDFDKLRSGFVSGNDRFNFCRNFILNSFLCFDWYICKIF